jgi:hypothetical protein
VKAYNATNQTYQIFVINGSGNTLSNFSTNSGYWINSTAGQTWSLSFN